jgi:hypothetical protein
MTYPIRPCIRGVGLKYKWQKAYGRPDPDSYEYLADWCVKCAKFRWDLRDWTRKAA